MSTYEKMKNRYYEMKAHALEPFLSSVKSESEHIQNSTVKHVQLLWERLLKLQQMQNAQDSEVCSSEVFESISCSLKSINFIPFNENYSYTYSQMNFSSFRLPSVLELPLQTMQKPLV